MPTTSKNFPHVCGFSQTFWDWAKEMSGQENPCPWIREEFNKFMIESLKNNQPAPAPVVVEEQPAPPPQKDYEALWAVFDCKKDLFDKHFMRARNKFVQEHGSQEAALQWLHERTRAGVKGRIETPRRWMISWYNGLSEDEKNVA
jgi:hypothetical protein